MKFTILIPHYKTGKMTAYAIHQLLKHKGRHELDIIVVDNSNDFDIKLIQNIWTVIAAQGCNLQVSIYPSDRLQSHGIAFDYAIQQGLVNTDYFITIESDSFPTHDKWLDYYEDLINHGYDMAGSLLTLSGGQYIHPCGAMYKVSNWKAALVYAEQVNRMYAYQRNCAPKNDDGFMYHAMLPQGGSFTDEDLAKIEYYKPCTKVFHNGMGWTEEDVKTYGRRDMTTGICNFMDPQPHPTIVRRVGYEPGQWFSYWHQYMSKKVHHIPTETQWLPNRRNQQQAYTLNQAGFKHLWGITAWHGSTAADMQDVIEFKKRQAEELYKEIGL